MSTPDPTPTAAIVTGAAGGIGAAEAELLIAAGHTVILNDIDEDRLVETARTLGSAAQAVPVAGDISQPETARALIAEATREGRRLHTVVNNAAALAFGMIYELSDEDFDRVVAVGLRGTFLLSREAATYWRDRARATGEVERANLINTTSRAALLANPGQASYAAAKAGVAVLAQTSARELRAYGVRSNCIAPRAYTRMMAATGKWRADAIEEWSPKHIARFVDFLCGPGGEGITGQVFVVHGPHIQLARTWAVSEPVDVDYSGGPDGVLGGLTSLFAGDPMAIEDFQVDDFPLEAPPEQALFTVDVAADVAADNPAEADPVKG